MATRALWFDSNHAWNVKALEEDLNEEDTGLDGGVTFRGRIGFVDSARHQTLHKDLHDVNIAHCHGSAVSGFSHAA